MQVERGSLGSTRRAKAGVPAAHGTANADGRGVEEAARLESGRPITPEKLPSSRIAETAPRPWIA